MTAAMRFRPADFLGASEALARVFDGAHQAANLDQPLFLSGESGTGKDKLALAIHPPRPGPMAPS